MGEEPNHTSQESLALNIQYYLVSREEKKRFRYMRHHLHLQRRLVRCNYCKRGEMSLKSVVLCMEDIRIVRRTRDRISVNTQGEKNHAKREERDVREKFTK